MIFLCFQKSISYADQDCIYQKLHTQKKLIFWNILQFKIAAFYFII